MTDISATVAAFMTNERPFGQVLADWAMTPLNAQLAAAERELAEFKAIAFGTVAFVPSGSSPQAVSPLRASIDYRKETFNGE